MYVSPDTAAGMLNSFFLGAGFQTPGFLEDDIGDYEPLVFESITRPEPATESAPRVKSAPLPPQGGFQKFLDIFCGNKTLATYWYEKACR